jgi:hypothetical protein
MGSLSPTQPSYCGLREVALAAHCYSLFLLPSHPNLMLPAAEICHFCKELLAFSRAERCPNAASANRWSKFHGAQYGRVSVDMDKSRVALENITRMVSTLQQYGYVDENWRLIAHKQVKLGDRVWVLKQGAGPMGIFGVGKIIKLPSRGEAGNGKIQWMAGIRFEAFVNPMNGFLIDEKVVRTVLSETQISARASGYPLQPDRSLEFERCFLNRW